MGVESTRSYGNGDRGDRVLDPRADDPLAPEPRDRDFQASRVDRANRRHWTGGREGRKEQREAQAPVHVGSMT